MGSMTTSSLASSPASVSREKILAVLCGHSGWGSESSCLPMAGSYSTARRHTPAGRRLVDRTREAILARQDSATSWLWTG